MRRSIVSALSNVENLLCVEADNGAQGLQQFHRERYDIVVTDINMPLMDGLKLINCIRGGRAAVGPPIVVVTTESAQEDREKALGLGANAYLLKPVEPDLISNTVRQLLGLPEPL